MKLTVYNETNEALSLCFLKPGLSISEASLAIAPRTSATSAVPSSSTAVRVDARVPEKEKLETESVVFSNGPFVTFPLKLGAKWKSVRIPTDSPWRIYRSKVRIASTIGMHEESHRHDMLI